MSPSHDRSHAEEVTLPLKGWVAVLTLSRIWGFEDLSTLAIAKLESIQIEEVYKIALAHRFELTSWYFDAYMALAKRTKSLTSDEVACLGLDFGMNMVKAREIYLKNAYSVHSKTLVCKAKHTNMNGNAQECLKALTSSISIGQKGEGSLISFVRSLIDSP